LLLRLNKITAAEGNSPARQGDRHASFLPHDDGLITVSGQSDLDGLLVRLVQAALDLTARRQRQRLPRLAWPGIKPARPGGSITSAPNPGLGTRL
jgi:hypothetical protein